MSEDPQLQEFLKRLKKCQITAKKIDHSPYQNLPREICQKILTYTIEDPNNVINCDFEWCYLFKYRMLRRDAVNLLSKVDRTMVTDIAYVQVAENQTNNLWWERQIDKITQSGQEITQFLESLAVWKEARSSEDLIALRKVNDEVGVRFITLCYSLEQAQFNLQAFQKMGVLEYLRWACDSTALVGPEDTEWWLTVAEMVKDEVMVEALRCAARLDEETANWSEVFLSFYEASEGLPGEEKGMKWGIHRRVITSVLADKASLEV